MHFSVFQKDDRANKYKCPSARGCSACRARSGARPRLGPAASCCPPASSGPIPCQQCRCVPGSPARPNGARCSFSSAGAGMGGRRVVDEAPGGSRARGAQLSHRGGKPAEREGAPGALLLHIFNVPAPTQPKTAIRRDLGNITVVIFSQAWPPPNLGLQYILSKHTFLPVRHTVDIFFLHLFLPEWAYSLDIFQSFRWGTLCTHAMDGEVTAVF